MTIVAVLGSGAVGTVLADGFLRHGFEVVRGSREPAKLADWLAKAGPKARTGTFAEAAAAAATVVLAVKGDAAESVLDLAGAQALAGKTVIDTTNPIAASPPVNGVLRYFTSLEEWLMERLQRRVPEARFVKAFSCVGSALMVDPKLPGGPPTMFIWGTTRRRSATSPASSTGSAGSPRTGRAEAARDCRSASSGILDPAGAAGRTRRSALGSRRPHAAGFRHATGSRMTSALLPAIPDGPV
jgi:predicted dinucleotide-binding enzyme